MGEFEKVQSVMEHITELMSIYVIKKLVKMKVVIVPENMDPTKKDAFEETMCKSNIEAFIAEAENDIVETDLGSK